MEEEYIAHIGNRVVGNQPFGIGKSARRQHLYTVGKTGTGKSTLLRNLIVQDIHAGKGVARRRKKRPPRHAGREPACL